MPNKILHEDFLGFIKELPLIQNYEVFNLSENSEIRFQEKEAKFLIRTFKLAINKPSDRQRDQAIDCCESLASLIPSDIEVPNYLSQKHSTFIIKEQVEAINQLITTMKTQLKRLISQLQGKLNLDKDSEELLEILCENKVPPFWVKLLDLSSNKMNVFMTKFEQICSYYRYAPEFCYQIFNSKIIDILEMHLFKTATSSG